MKVLVFGGTKFVGRAMVEALLERGHQVDLVHRGSSGSDLFDGKVRKFHCDRLESLEDIPAEEWDAVLDVSAYVPRAVRMAIERLAERVKAYALVSTISVYKSDQPTPILESGPLEEVLDPDIEEVNGETYGYLKVLCEQAVVSAYPNALLIRPGLVVGPNDHTDRFPYWIRRIGAQDAVAAPNAPKQPIQWIDARDLGRWTAKALENNLSGAYNLCGDDHLFNQMVEGIRAAINPTCKINWVEQEVLEKHGVEPGQDLPFYIGDRADTRLRTSNACAKSQGLTLRPLTETARDTWEYVKTQQSREWAVGLSDERERELLSLVPTGQTN